MAAGRGEGSVTVTFQDNAVRQHVTSDGTPVNAGHIDAHNMLLDVTYGTTEKLALNISVPYVSARYKGQAPHPASILDDGDFHGTWQDFRLNLRYGLVTAVPRLRPTSISLFPVTITTITAMQQQDGNLPTCNLAQV
jgi:hypothetical protein